MWRNHTYFLKLSRSTVYLDSIYKRYGMPNDMLIKLNQRDFKVEGCARVYVRPVYNIGGNSWVRLIKVIPKISWLLLNRFREGLILMQWDI